MTNTNARANHPTDRLVAEIAWLYYIRGITQGEIAKLKNLSRPTIITYLKMAKERGLVSIKLDPAHLELNELGLGLIERFGLRDVHVVPNEGLRGRDLTKLVSEVAAHLLPSRLGKGSTLGVSWGETISMLAEAVPIWPTKELTVRQLIGSMANPLVMTSESCTTEIARRLGGACINMNAPAACTNSALAEMLRQEPIIAEQLANLSTCTHAVFSLSISNPDAHVVQFKVATAEDVEVYKSKGAVCNLVGRFLDAGGVQIHGPLDDRLFAVNLEALKKMQGLLVVAGQKKAEAARAALRGGYVTDMVLDAALATKILKLG